MSWNPGIEGGKGSGSGCRTSCRGIMKKEEKKVRIRLSKLMSWNHRKEDKMSGSGGQASKFKLESLETEKKGQSQAVNFRYRYHIPETWIIRKTG